MMRFFTLLTALVACVAAQADNLVVKNVTVPQGGKATVEVELNNPDHEFTAFQMALELPDGISGVLNAKDKLTIKDGDRFDDHGLSASSISGGFQFACLSNTSAPISGNSGVLFSFDIAADANLEVGQVLEAKFTGIAFTTTGQAVEITMDDVTFTLTVVENRVVLDENATVAPEASEGAVNVKVLRTITADTWSTICLPFAMTEEQVADAFGADVQLADFTGYDATYDEAEENVLSLQINFETVSAIEANHPYIIKIAQNVTEFSVDGVTIDPEEAPSVSFGYESGKGKNKVYHPIDFTGTYVAGFDFFNDATVQAVFLSGNKFWYATEATKSMKGFRAYFDFDDVLAEVAESEVKMFIDGQPTRIDEMANGQSVNGQWYDLSGRKVSRAQKGVYVIDGKKVIK